MNDSVSIVNFVYRSFLLSWIFAVLWVKEYLWWTFTIAGLLLVFDVIVLPVLALSRSIPVESNATASRPRPLPPTSDGGDEGDRCLARAKAAPVIIALEEIVIVAIDVLTE
jgi:hypothetical protein